MKLIQVSTLINPQTLKTYYKLEVRNLVHELISNKDITMLQLLSKFSEGQISNAIEDIYLHNDFICIPERTFNSQILRYLEFGGEGIASLGILRRAAQHFKE